MDEDAGDVCALGKAPGFARTCIEGSKPSMRTAAVYLTATSSSMPCMPSYDLYSYDLLDRDELVNAMYAYIAMT